MVVTALTPPKSHPLQACCADDPDEICAAKVPRMDLDDVSGNELEEFVNLVHLDCAENRLGGS